MSSLNERIWCDYKCPLHEECRNYADGFDKTRTVHWGVNPYNHDKDKCVGFERIEPIDFNQLNIVSNA